MMGVLFKKSLGGFTPICSSCGVALCWDISQDEYDERPNFWEGWICRDCVKLSPSILTTKIIWEMVRDGKRRRITLPGNALNWAKLRNASHIKLYCLIDFRGRQWSEKIIKAVSVSNVDGLIIVDME